MVPNLIKTTKENKDHSWWRKKKFGLTIITFGGTN
jgi:hypothetical protein